MSGALVTAWDCREDEWWNEREAKTEWLRSHALPFQWAYRMEFYDAPPRVKVFCYAPDAQGKRHHVHAPGDCTPEKHGPDCVARDEPRELMLAQLPPVALR